MEKTIFSPPRALHFVFVPFLKFWLLGCDGDLHVARFSGVFAGSENALVYFKNDAEGKKEHDGILSFQTTHSFICSGI